MCNTESKLFIKIKSDEYQQNLNKKTLTDNSLGIIILCRKHANNNRTNTNTS